MLCFGWGVKEQFARNKSAGPEGEKSLKKKITKKCTGEC